MTSEHHRFFSLKYKGCKTRKDRANIEKQTGVRYSVLTELPYFDCVRLHIATIGDIPKCQVGVYSRTSVYLPLWDQRMFSILKSSIY